MQFDKVFNSKTTQREIFSEVSGSIDRFLKGENQAILAYGQTGAGKTFSMIGDYNERNLSNLDLIKNDNKGIVLRTLEKIIGHVKNLKNVKLWTSFLEVYNEKINDLLNPKDLSKSTGLELREYPNGDNQIQDLTHVEIKTLDDALDCLRTGLKNRITGSTHANQKSSRSHSIFQIILTQSYPKDPSKVIVSKFRLVDLAGSEKFKIERNIPVEEKEARILELTSINGSLSALGHCVSALTESNRTHIPYRNSKLTRILRDSLSAGSKLSFIMCISPAMDSINESISTLQFASRAKKIILDRRFLEATKSRESRKMSHKEQYEEMITLLKQIMESHVSSENQPSEVKIKLEILENQLKALQEQNDALTSEVRELKRSYSPLPKSSSDASPMRTYASNSNTDSNSPRTNSFNISQGERIKNTFYKSQDKQNSKSSVALNYNHADAFQTNPVDKEFTSNSNDDYNTQSSRFQSNLTPERKPIISQENWSTRQPTKSAHVQWYTEDDYGDDTQRTVVKINSGMKPPTHKERANTTSKKLKPFEAVKNFELNSNEPQPEISNITSLSRNSYTRNDSTLFDHSERNSYRELAYQLSKNHNSNQQYQEPELNQKQMEYLSSHYNQVKISANQDIDEEFQNDRRNHYSSSKKINQSSKKLNDSRDDLEHLSYSSEIILKEFDKKLSSVHELNKQHQDLIKNLDNKLAEIQENCTTNLKYYEVDQSPTVTKENTASNYNSKIKLETEQKMKNISKTVSELKSEVSKTLDKVQSIQDLKPDNSLRGSNSYLEKLNHGEESNQSIQNYHTESKREISPFGTRIASFSSITSGERSSISSRDIVRMQWSLFQESLKGNKDE